MTMVLTNMLALGSAVRQARTEAGLTQAQLAELAAVSRVFVVNLERGHHPRAEVGRVLLVLGALGKGIALLDAPQRPSLDEALAEILGDLR